MASQKKLNVLRRMHNMNVMMPISTSSLAHQSGMSVTIRLPHKQFDALAMLAIERSQSLESLGQEALARYIQAEKCRNDHSSPKLAAKGCPVLVQRAGVKAAQKAERRHAAVQENKKAGGHIISILMIFAS